MSGIKNTQVSGAQDDSTGASSAVDYDHHELHEGSSFTVCDVQSVDTTTMKWQITTPDSTKYSHMVFNPECTGEFYMLVTEASDRVDGTALVEMNRRRVGTPKVPGTIVTRTPTGGATDGAMLFAKRSGATGVAAKTVAAGSSRGTNEWILKPNTKYVVSITTYATVFVTFCVDWYEHTDKN